MGALLAAQSLVIYEVSVVTSNVLFVARCPAAALAWHLSPARRPDILIIFSVIYLVMFRSHLERPHKASLQRTDAAAETHPIPVSLSPTLLFLRPVASSSSVDSPLSTSVTPSLVHSLFTKPSHVRIHGLLPAGPDLSMRRPWAGSLLFRSPYPPPNAIIYMHLQL